MKDRLQSEKIEVVHCPTEAMLADFLRKPLQGSLFRKNRDVLLGYQHITKLQNMAPSASSSEECVGKFSICDDNFKVVEVLWPTQVCDDTPDSHGAQEHIMVLLLCPLIALRI
jgi:hypothetical protein